MIGGDMLASARKTAERRAIFFALWCAVMFGGAANGGVLANGALQACAACALLGAALLGDFTRLPGKARTVQILFWLLAGLVALTLLPLPPDLWAMAPGRDRISQLLDLTGAGAGARPLSLAPEETAFGFLRFLPPLALFTFVFLTHRRTLASTSAWAILIIGALSAVLGLLQVFDGQESALYLYEFTARGQAVGLFANPNHQAVFLVACLPFAAVQAARLRSHWEAGDADQGMALALFALAMLIVLGVIAAGSVAGYALLALVILLSVFLFAGRVASWSAAGGAIGGAALVSGLGYVAATSPVLSRLGVTSINDEPLGRTHTWELTTQIVRDHFPFGSGLGSFRDLFPSYEDPTQVTSTFMNHAHNDYLEWVMEMGLPGLILLGVFFCVWGLRMVAVWRERDGHGARVRKAASIATTVFILHSLVDYPLRTSGGASFFAFCFALMLMPSFESPSASRRRRPTPGAAAESTERHVEI